ncbi:efflux RND transporter periplasmic adaptor subunit [Oceanobacter mangrovi]|uniref:efflux RND transporter periplasmic adaptor subunit n=1 Tax=Oceanobacter mangrovi TaxID=2862510 RepID=UPI001C8F0963|nr:efflux RND transporter periplasmic adaptor subunit [Oceanobacter mangrovi]
MSVPLRRTWWLLPVALVVLLVYRWLQLQGSEELQPQVQPPVKVETIQVVPQTLTQWVFAEGTVQASRKAYLNFESSGRVERIARLADGSQLREGIRVFGPVDGARHGQLLAQIDSRDNYENVQSLEAQLQSMRAQKREAEARLQQAENEQQLSDANFARSQEVFETGAISRKDFDREKTSNLNAATAVQVAQTAVSQIDSQIRRAVAELNRATIALEKTSLFAPFDGVITAMNIREQNYFYPSRSGNNDRDQEASAAIVVVDDASLEVSVELDTRQAALLQEGQRVMLAGDDAALYKAEQQADFSQISEGRVWSVSPAINLQSRTQRVRVRIGDGNRGLLEGQYVRAWIEARVLTDIVAIPIHALSFQQGQPFVFVLNTASGKVERRDVTLGAAGLQLLQVSDGLQPGDEVVSRGQHLLVDGADAVAVGG